MSNGSTERRNQGLEEGWVCVGAFGPAHGVHGDIKVRAFTENPTDLFAFKALHRGANGPLVKLKKKRDDKDDGFVVTVDGVKTREDAMALKGRKLFVPREALDDLADEDEFYLADLIGLTAEDEGGTEIGFVRAVENFGAEDLVEIVLKAPVEGIGRFAFVPFRKVFVPVVDIKGSRLVIAFADWVEAMKEGGFAPESEEGGDGDDA
ncbi:ribosome maturation factor RimM [Gimibacter soli]|uniref:Ribosome maturation factor RimM n=1 Tax=Gimibacter soli TaxID=3024400 RepID=A0AAE9XPU2_9PROT|nr:ribosome maturation factor RimM [Gimibacter soli]WCL54037.1 ribosome maturation factor RimM [Gimibacter soli]